jgi:prophage regulatory protein
MADSILRLPAVKTRTGLSRSTIYLRVSQGVFPKPVSLGGRAVGWVEAEIQNGSSSESRRGARPQPEWSPCAPAKWKALLKQFSDCIATVPDIPTALRRYLEQILSPFGRENPAAGTVSLRF